MAEATGSDVGKLAAIATRSPHKLSLDQIKSLGASALTQRPNRKKPAIVRGTLLIDGWEWEITLKPLKVR